MFTKAEEAAIRKTPSEVRDAFIRLNWHIEVLKEIWFWHRWMKTERWREAMGCLAECIVETDEAMVSVCHVNIGQELHDFWFRAYTLFRDQGGRFKKPFMQDFSQGRGK